MFFKLVLLTLLVSVALGKPDVSNNLKCPKDTTKYCAGAEQFQSCSSCYCARNIDLRAMPVDPEDPYLPFTCGPEGGKSCFLMACGSNRDCDRMCQCSHATYYYATKYCI